MAKRQRPAVNYIPKVFCFDIVYETGVTCYLLTITGKQDILFQGDISVLPTTQNDTILTIWLSDYLMRLEKLPPSGQFKVKFVAVSGDEDSEPAEIQFDLTDDEIAKLALIIERKHLAKTLRDFDSRIGDIEKRIGSAASAEELKKLSKEVEKMIRDFASFNAVGSDVTGIKKAQAEQQKLLLEIQEKIDDLAKRPAPPEPAPTPIPSAPPTPHHPHAHASAHSAPVKEKWGWLIPVLIMGLICLLPIAYLVATHKWNSSSASASSISPAAMTEANEARNALSAEKAKSEVLYWQNYRLSTSSVPAAIVMIGTNIGNNSLFIINSANISNVNNNARDNHGESRHQKEACQPKVAPAPTTFIVSNYNEIHMTAPAPAPVYVSPPTPLIIQRPSARQPQANVWTPPPPEPTYSPPIPPASPPVYYPVYGPQVEQFCTAPVYYSGTYQYAPCEYRGFRVNLGVVRWDRGHYGPRPTPRQGHR